jgi:hypothetical protein
MDILQSKTGFPAVSEEFVDRPVDEYYEAMTKVHSRPRIDLLEKVKGRISSIVEFMFRGQVFRPRNLIPSCNASNEFSRTNGGSFGFLLSQWARQELIDLEKNELRGDLGTPPVRIVTLQQQGIQKTLKLGTPGTDFVPSFQRVVDDLCFKVLESETIRARIFPIKEPFKVRLITCEEAAVIYRATEMQKFVHRRVSSFPPFEFIAKPIDDKSWARHFKCSFGVKFNSGDYEASTNNIDPELSEFTFTEICRQVHFADGEGADRLDQTVWHLLGTYDLVQHTFVHPRSLETRSQSWGQLMGSPTSFPILCIINLAVSSLAMDLSIDDLFKPDCPLVVNGDDLAAAMTDSQYLSWREYAASAGLLFSLGKNYFSDRFCIMNSECRLHRPDGSWERIGALNQSLLRGFEKKGMMAGADIKPTMGWWSLGPRSIELIEGFRREEAKKILRIFLAYHSNVVRTIPPGVSLFASNHLGGAGVPYLFENEIPVDNRRFHTYISCLDEIKRSRTLSFPSAPKSMLDRWLSDSEKYYEKYFSFHWAERDPMDITLEQWGFPIEREKSDVGSFLRLGYVLDQYSKYFATQSPTEMRNFVLGQMDPRTLRHTMVIGKADPLDETTFAGLVKRVNSRLTKVAQKAKANVAEIERPYWYSLFENFVTQQRLWLITVDKLTSWEPPVEKVIDYPSLPPVEILRFGRFHPQRQYSQAYQTQASWPGGAHQFLPIVVHGERVLNAEHGVFKLLKKSKRTRPDRFCCNPLGEDYEPLAAVRRIPEGQQSWYGAVRRAEVLHQLYGVSTDVPFPVEVLPADRSLWPKDIDWTRPILFLPGRDVPKLFKMRPNWTPLLEKERLFKAKSPQGTLLY